jgi:amino acid transporter
VKEAFQTVFWHFLLFFIMASISVCIFVPHDDPALIANCITNIADGSKSSSSPFIIAMMRNLQISGLPHVINGCSSLHLLCGKYVHILRQPKPLRLVIRELRGSDPLEMHRTRRAHLLRPGDDPCKAQGIDRIGFPYYGLSNCMRRGLESSEKDSSFSLLGYGSFCHWNVSSFLTNYTMVIFAFVTLIFWKVPKRAKMVGPLEADLVCERPIVDLYEGSMLEEPRGFWREMGR